MWCVLKGSRAADLDGDGDFELYEMKSNTAPMGGWGTYAVFDWNDTTHQFEQKTPWETRHKLDLLDMNGDGLVDKIESVPNGHQARWQVHFQSVPPKFDFNPDPDFTIDTGYDEPPTDCKQLTFAGDFDGDGRGEIVMPSSTCGDMLRLCIPGTCLTSSVRLRFGALSRKPALLDLAEIIFAMLCGLPARALRCGGIQAAASARPSPSRKRLTKISGSWTSMGMRGKTS